MPSHPVKPAGHRKLIGGEAKFFAAGDDWRDKGLAGATGASRRPGPPAKAEAATAGYLFVPIYGRKWILINRLPKRKLR
jgi:hypothetical protein